MYSFKCGYLSGNHVPEQYTMYLITNEEEIDYAETHLGMGVPENEEELYRFDRDLADEFQKNDQQDYSNQTTDHICNRSCPYDSVCGDPQTEQKHERNIDDPFSGHGKPQGLEPSLRCLEQRDDGIGKSRKRTSDTQNAQDDGTFLDRGRISQNKP